MRSPPTACAARDQPQPRGGLGRAGQRLHQLQRAGGARTLAGGECRGGVILGSDGRHAAEIHCAAQRLFLGEQPIDNVWRAAGLVPAVYTAGTSPAARQRQHAVVSGVAELAG